MLNLPDNQPTFRPLRVMLEMVAHGEMESRLLAFGLTVSNETNAEIQRISGIIDRISSGKTTFIKEIEAIELTESNARNNVKILPSMAEQLGLLQRSGGITKITPYGRTVLFELSRQAVIAPEIAVTRRREPFSRIVTSDEELKRKWKPEATEDVDYDPKDETDRLASLRERTDEHQEILSRLRKIFSDKSWTVGVGNFDLLAVKDRIALLLEGKTINANERLQLIDGLGKLTYYEVFDVVRVLNDPSVSVHKVLVFSRAPTQAHMDFLTSLGIWVVWFDREGNLDGEKSSKASLQKLLDASN